jgi:hypothetical protein
MLKLGRATSADGDWPGIRVSVGLDKTMTGRGPGRHTAAEDIPDKLVGSAGRRDLYPLVQAVIVLLRGRAVIHQDQVAVGLVGIPVQCVIGNIASRIIGKAGPSPFRRIQKRAFLLARRWAKATDGSSQFRRTSLPGASPNRAHMAPPAGLRYVLFQDEQGARREGPSSGCCNRRFFYGKVGFSSFEQNLSTTIICQDQVHRPIGKYRSYYPGGE